MKDARVIAQLVKDGRYAEPTIPQGVYAELRVAKKLRDLLIVDQQIVQGQIHNWIDRYFPEFLTVFKNWEGKAALQLLKLNVLPHELAEFSDQELLTYLRKAVTTHRPPTLTPLSYSKERYVDYLPIVLLTCLYIFYCISF